MGRVSTAGHRRRKHFLGLLCVLLRQGSQNFLATDRSQYEASIGEAEVARVEISCQGLEGTVGLCLLRAVGDLKVLKTEAGEGGRGKGEQTAPIFQ